MADSFQNYQDIWQDTDDLQWFRGPTDDALNGCVLVNPRFSEELIVAIKPLISGAVTVVEYLKGLVEVKPND